MYRRDFFSKTSWRNLVYLLKQHTALYLDKSNSSENPAGVTMHTNTSIFPCPSAAYTLTQITNTFLLSYALSLSLFVNAIHNIAREPESLLAFLSVG